jgi:hypothetical protein
MGGRLRRPRPPPPSRPTGPVSGGSAAAVRSAPIVAATSGGGRPWPTLGAGPIEAGCWAPNPDGTNLVAGATGRPLARPWSTWPAGAATATSGISTATDPAAPSVARSVTAASWKEQHMRQHQDPDDFYHKKLDRYDDGDEEDLEALGTPVYQGSGLSVRALTAEELQRFLGVHQGQPARLLGSGWDAATALRPPHGSQLGKVGSSERVSSIPEAPPVGPVSGSLGSPGRSALATARRRRSQELAGWTRSLTWRAPLVAAAGLTTQVLTAQAGQPAVGLPGLAAAALVGWRLRFRPSEQVAAWRHGAHGERRTARLLGRLVRDGYVVFHDLAVPDSDANLDHLVIGPSGVFVIDSKQWTGSVHEGSDGLAWHNHYPLDRTLETVRWEARIIGRLLGTRAAAVVCVHGAQVQGGGLNAQGVAIVPASLLRSALGYDRVLSDAEVELLATTAWTRLRPAA